MDNNQQDQDLLKLIKKSKRKKRLQTIFSPLVLILLTLTISSTLLLNYFNIGPFSDNKIAGLPDNHLRWNQTNSAFNNLIFNLSSSYDFNYYGKHVELWFAHYQDGKKVSSKQIGPIASYDSESKKSEIRGSLAYGMGNKTEEEFILSYHLEVNGASGTNQINLKDYGIKNTDLLSYTYGIYEMTNSQTFFSENTYSIEPNTTYDILVIRNDGISYMSTNREQQMKNVPNGFVLYLIFK